MSEERETIHTEQYTFNALGRSAMIAGVPLIALALTGFITVMATMVLMPFLGGKALLLLAMIIPVFMFLRTICANDDQAVRIIKLETMWFFRKRNSKNFGGTNTILANKFGRVQSDYQRFMDASPEAAARTRRFHAETLPTRHK
jgi:type IV secretion system protein VirB3